MEWRLCLCMRALVRIVRAMNPTATNTQIFQDEHEPDVYARTFRTSILDVWKETLSKVNKLDVQGGRWYPEDLSGPGTGMLDTPMSRR